MDVTPLLGSYDFEVSKSHGREAREAHIEVRAKKVELQIHVPKKRTKRGKYRARGERLRFIEMWAVLAREVGTVPRDEEPVEWLLLTNRPVKSLSMAKLVIRGYSYRWRIEDFHRTWKTTCRVEDAQLRSAGAVERWAVTLAVVAMRIQRLMYLARTQPELPATEELTRDEIGCAAGPGRWSALRAVLELHRAFARLPCTSTCPQSSLPSARRGRPHRWQTGRLRQSSSPVLTSESSVWILCFTGLAADSVQLPGRALDNRPDRRA
jgi:hypothetical protein